MTLPPEEALPVNGSARTTNRQKRLAGMLAASLLLHLAVLPLDFGTVPGAAGIRAVLQVVIATEAPVSAREILRPVAEPAIKRNRAQAPRNGKDGDTDSTELAPPEPVQVEVPPVLRTAPPSPPDLPFGEQQGYAILELTIDSAGRAIAASILDASLAEDHRSAIEELARAALFDPARQGSRPVAGRTIMRFEYRPADPEALQYQWLPDYRMNEG
ncbi:MAG TPA: hypothetical protein VF096_15855 [Azonexus sp.]